MAAPVRAGDVIAHKYVVDRVLGQGGMGVVVSASHATLKQRVALKFLLPEACEHPGAVERFLREARAAVQIQSEHVARVTDVGTLETGAPYMVMEFLEGHDLARELELRGALPVEEAAEYLLQASEAIAEAHALGIVHRDLKPANLFLTQRKDGSRTLKVLDFGISKAVQDGDVNLTQTATMMGSPLYMAPEQIRNAKAVDARADVWSLGVILHESLAGSVPFGGETLSGVLASIVADPPQPLATFRPDLPETLISAVSRCLEKDPARRVQDVAELAGLLAPFAPVQAQRTLPRVESLLGRTTRPSLGGEQALADTAVGTTADDGTTRPWAKTDSPVRSGRRAIVWSLGAGAVLLGGIGMATLFMGGGDEVEDPLAAEDASLSEVAASGSATTPSGLPSPAPADTAPSDASASASGASAVDGASVNGASAGEGTPASKASADPGAVEASPGAAEPRRTAASLGPAPAPKAAKVSTSVRSPVPKTSKASPSQPKPAIAPTSSSRPKAPAALDPLDGRR